MKQLKDYIIEHQQINETGLRDTLFGEIVMKVLGTGLDWIGKGTGWLADSFKEALAGGFNALKDAGDKTFTSFVNKHHIHKAEMPKNEKDLAGFFDKILHDEQKSYEDKYDIFKDWGKEFKDLDTSCVYICKLQLENAGKKDITVEKLKEYAEDLNELYTQYKGKLSKKTINTIKETMKKLEERAKQIEKDNKEE